jgi:hypothetical protein
MFKHINLLIDLQKGELLYQNLLAKENPGKINGFYTKTWFRAENLYSKWEYQPIKNGEVKNMDFKTS